MARLSGNPMRVALIYGGRSAEHAISRVSAAGVAAAIDTERYEIVPIAITRDGEWVTPAGVGEMLAAGFKTGVFPEALPTEGPALADFGSLDCDVAFPVLHGPYGEDGTIQGYFEILDIPYVGSGVLGSAVAMDKVMAKRAMSAAGLAIPAQVEVRRGDDVSQIALRVASGIGFPCFVKPSAMGSSIGVTRADNEGALVGALELAFSFDEWVLIEEAIIGREIEVAILGDNPPAASLPGEIIPGDDFYSFADKYENSMARLDAPADLNVNQIAQAQEIAIRAFMACRVEVMARVDLFLETETRNGSLPRGFLVNEVNTIPGFTPISMYPRLWEVTGVARTELVDRLIELALERHTRRRGQSPTSF